MAQRFAIMPGAWAVTRLTSAAPLPNWALNATGFVSITRTDDELSIVCRESAVPHDVLVERGWAMLKIQGPFPFTQVGVLASLASPLATAEISLFAISTFDTDYILVKATQLDAACESLIAAGHDFVG